MVGAQWFEPLMIGLIIFNGVLIGLETSRDIVARYDGWLQLGNDLILAVFIDDPVSIGDYRFTDDPADPVLLHSFNFPIPGEKGMSPRDQSTAGRYLLTTLTFEDMEREMRDLLDRALAGSGFDAARDIEALTINRWSHGYALEYEISRILCDARILNIFEGAAEIQAQVIARGLAGGRN